MMIQEKECSMGKGKYTRATKEFKMEVIRLANESFKPVVTFLMASRYSQFLSLPGNTPLQTLVVSKYQADGQLITPQHLQNLPLAMTCFHENVNLVSFLLGKPGEAANMCTSYWTVAGSQNATAACTLTYR